MAGLRYNDGKRRYGLLSEPAIEELVKVLEHGAAKYTTAERNGDWNWAEGLSWAETYESLRRHLTAWYCGEDADPWSGLPHMAHVLCNAMFLMHFELYGTGKDDRPAALNNNKEKQIESEGERLRRVAAAGLPDRGKVNIYEDGCLFTVADKFLDEYERFWEEDERKHSFPLTALAESSGAYGNEPVTSADYEGLDPVTPGYGPPVEEGDGGVGREAEVGRDQRIGTNPCARPEFADIGQLSPFRDSDGGEPAAVGDKVYTIKNSRVVDMGGGYVAVVWDDAVVKRRVSDVQEDVRTPAKRDERGD